MAETKAKTTMLERIFGRHNETVGVERAKRWADMAAESSEDVVRELRKRVRALEEKLANHLDISTSNDLNTANRVGADGWDSNKFAATYHEIKRDLALAEDDLKIAENAHKDLTARK